MKKILTTIAVLSAIMNLYSQTARIDEILMHNIEGAFFQNEGGIDEGFFENYPNQILKVGTFGYTSVIDSVIATSVSGDKEKNTYSYNPNGNMILHLSEFWDGSQWVNSAKTIFNYDSNGYRISSLLERWIDSNWVNSTQDNFTYDHSGNTTSMLLRIWGDSNWVNYYRYTWIFDSNGNEVSRLKEKWQDADWIHSWLDTHTNDSNGNITSTLREKWDGSDWINLMRFTNTFNTNGDLISVLFEYWGNTDWDFSQLMTNTYDVTGNVISVLYEEWNSSDWRNKRRDNYTYDSNSNLTLWVSEYWDGYIWEQNNDGPFSFKDIFGNNYYYYASKVDFSYKMITYAEKEDIAVSNYSLSQNYPNPFNPSTVISYSLAKRGNVELKIYDVLGREVATLVNKNQSAGNYEVQFDASASSATARNLTSGIYFYRLQSGNFVESKKMVLVK